MYIVCNLFLHYSSLLFYCISISIYMYIHIFFKPKTLQCMFDACNEYFGNGVSALMQKIILHIAVITKPTREKPDIINI